MCLRIYTDGGCHGNPGPGGWAFVMVDETEQLIAQASGNEENTTNNRMELLAVIKALEAVSGMKAQSLAVVTDSQYVQQGITKWIHNWKGNGWQTSSKQPVKNRDLWERLDAFPFKIQWFWVRGHAGNAFNELCDKLTQEAIALLT